MLVDADNATGGDSSSAGNATSTEDTNVDSSDNSATGGDVSGADDTTTDTSTSETDEGASDGTPPEDKKSGRAVNRIRELAEEKNQWKTMAMQLAQERRQSEATATAKPKVDLSGAAPEEVERAKELIRQLGGVGDLEAQVKALQTQLFNERDTADRRRVVEKFKGTVTEDEITDAIQTWKDDPDPSIRARANLPNEDIAFILKRDALVEKEVSAVLQKKKTPLPKVDGAKSSTPLPKPDEKKFKWDNKDPLGSFHSLQNTILERMATKTTNE